MWQGCKKSRAYWKCETESSNMKFTALERGVVSRQDWLGSFPPKTAPCSLKATCYLHHCSTYQNKKKYFQFLHFTSNQLNFVKISSWENWFVKISSEWIELLVEWEEARTLSPNRWHHILTTVLLLLLQLTTFLLLLHQLLTPHTYHCSTTAAAIDYFSLIRFCNLTTFLLCYYRLLFICHCTLLLSPHIACILFYCCCCNLLLFYSCCCNWQHTTAATDHILLLHWTTDTTYYCSTTPAAAISSLCTASIYIKFLGKNS